jgi:uncharacterized protein YgbK (DUF1537 family)
MAPWLGCIADDYTGATDLASMLVRAGLRVVQCFGIPDDAGQWADADAVVVSLKSRSVAADQAVCSSLDALRFLQFLGIKRFFFKYCSTFDSTRAGNIGPVADALTHELNAGEVIFCPAFPENGRTVYCGHLFVGGVLLHESSLRNHPLNPMTDSNLVRVLQAQSTRPVQVLTLGEALDTYHDCHLIADSINDDGLRRIARRARDHRLLTGSSAIARYWAEELIASSNQDVSQHRAMRSERNNSVTESLHCRSIILAGSCSEATRSQIAEFAKRFPVCHLDLTLHEVQKSASAALAWCDRHWDSPEHGRIPLLICSGASPAAIDLARRRWGEELAALRVEQAFALIAQGLMQRDVRRLIVAGGETSGAVIDALRIPAVRIGCEIAPGVPWVETRRPPELALALKSGNFGGPRFFFDALESAP